LALPKIWAGYATAGEVVVLAISFLTNLSDEKAFIVDFEKGSIS